MHGLHFQRIRFKDLKKILHSRARSRIIAKNKEYGLEEVLKHPKITKSAFEALSVTIAYFKKREIKEETKKLSLWKLRNELEPDFKKWMQKKLIEEKQPYSNTVLQLREAFHVERHSLDYSNRRFIFYSEFEHASDFMKAIRNCNDRLREALYSKFVKEYCSENSIDAVCLPECPYPSWNNNICYSGGE